MNKKKLIIITLVLTIILLLYLFISSYRKYNLDPEIQCEVANEICTCLGFASRTSALGYPPIHFYECSGLELCVYTGEEIGTCYSSVIE